MQSGKIEASYKNEVLIITVPESEETKKKQIDNIVMWF